MNCLGQPPPDWTVAGSVSEVREVPADRGVWLRGTELGGEHGAITLIRAAIARGGPWVCEGLGPQGMAASLALGAVGVAAGQEVAADVAERLAEIRATDVLGRDPLGCGLPVVQGPMANIAERPDLARAVSRAGAMPFAALGALRPARARQVLREFADALGARPWGVGVIGFEAMPHRKAHLDAIRELGERRPGAVILAGSPDALALEVQADGLPVWLHTPSGFLAGQALERGVRAVVLEGREAGGHVGRKPSASLWEEGLEAALDHGGRVVLAGGISDPVSAAFAAAMGARASACGVEVVLQAGTAFLATHEIIESGQLTPAAQQALLAARETVLVGETVNLPLRCVPNRFTRDARELERAWQAEGLSLAERRARMEAFNLGRTRVAAKGIERDGAPGRYRTVPVDRQRAQGAFTVGESALLTDGVQTVNQVVRALTRDAAAILHGRAPRPSLGVAGGPREGRSRARPEVRLGPAAAAASAPIAIVGLGGVLPGAPDVATFWANLLGGQDAIGPIPSTRWRTERYFHRHADRDDTARSSSRAAGLLGPVDIDPLRFRIPPALLPTIDPVQRLALLAAEQATRDAGWDRQGFDRKRAAVILGNSMGGEHAKDLVLRVRFRDVLAALEAEGALDGLHPDARRALTQRVEDHLAAQLPPIQAESMAGLLANVVAGRVASWLDWMGGNLTVDAACAASLASVAIAVDWLRSGRCDAVLAGGVDADLSPETFTGFSKTLALSAEVSSPFSRHADGFTMGEGCAILALRRLDDALALDEPVYAVIRGVGQASDGRARGITAPRASGQRLAIERAWSQADEDLGRCSLIEAHGTGTPVGDATEIEVWRDLLADTEARPWLGTVKASIGHLKGGAGAAGLLKTTLALATRTVPPTLHAGPVLPALEGPLAPVRLPRGPVRLPDDPRAGVSAFGFGGTNFHAVLAPAPPEAQGPASLPSLVAMAEADRLDAEEATWKAGAEAPLLLAYAAETRDALSDAVRADRPTTPELAATAPWRCVVLADPSRRGETAIKVATWLDQAEPNSRLGRTATLGQGAPRPVVLLVPGQGAQHPEQTLMLRQLRPPRGRALPDGSASDPLALHRSLVPLAMAWADLVREAGIPVAATLGHSLGEIGALYAAGRLEAEDALRVAEARGDALERVPAGGMLAVRLSEADATNRAAGLGLELSAVNGPEACVLAGPLAAIARAEQALAADGLTIHRLPVARAFHTASTLPAAAQLAETLAEVGFRDGRPVWSGALGRPMSDPAEDLVHAVRAPVRFAAAVQELAREDVGFLELGPGKTLTGLVTANAPDALAVALDPEPGDGGGGLAFAAATLLALGHPGLVRLLPATRLRLALPAPEVSESVPATSPPPPEQRHDLPAVGEDSIRATVVEAICDVTGYPPDFIEDDAELEAELGIDSIRKLEILGRLEKAHGFRATESDYGVLERADVDRLVAFVRERSGARPADVPGERSTGLWTEFWRPVSLPTVSREPHAPGLTVDGDTWVLSPRAIDAADPAAATRAAVSELLHACQTLDRPAAIRLIAEPTRAASAARIGFCRSLAAEWGIDLRVVECADPSSPRAHGLARLAAVGVPSLVRLDGDQTTIREWIPAALPTPPFREPHLLCTGGLAGILGAVLQGLVDLAPRVSLLARTGPDDDGPRADAHREARRALSDAGVEIEWIRCDLTDEAQVARAVETLVHGPPDLVLHAAGALADGPVEDLVEEAVDRVLGPKITGMAHLAAHLPRDTRWLRFSSIAARMGNRHQTLYAAANQAFHGWGLPGTTVDLTAWSDRGMAADPTVGRLLRARGLRPITPEEGALAMREVVLATLADGAPHALTLVGAPPPGARPPSPPLSGQRSVAADTWQLALHLDPHSPALADHKVAGRSLVPAAVHLHAVREAWLLGHPGQPVAIEDFRVLVPVFVDGPRDDLTLELGPGGRVAVRNGRTPLATGRVREAASPDADPQWAPPSTPVQAPYEAGILFHGPAWQVLGDVRIGPRHATATLHPTSAPTVAAWIDGAHQLLALWAHGQAGWLGLPVAADRWWVAAAPGQGPWRLQLSAEVDGERAFADLSVVDAHGRPVLFGEGVTLRRAAEPADV